MSVIYDPATQAHLTIDPAPKAARVTLYDARAHASGRKNCYAAAMTTKLALLDVNQSVFMVLFGADSRVVRVQRILVSVWPQLSGYIDVAVDQRTAPPTTGGAGRTLLAAVPLDIEAAPGAKSTVATYTTSPTGWDGGGTIATLQRFATPLGTIGPHSFYDFDWRHRHESEAPVLRGSNEAVTVGCVPNLGGGGGSPNVLGSIWWTEEERS